MLDGHRLGIWDALGHRLMNRIGTRAAVLVWRGGSSAAADERICGSEKHLMHP